MSSVCEDQKQHERRIPKVHRGIKRKRRGREADRGRFKFRYGENNFQPNKNIGENNNTESIRIRIPPPESSPIECFQLRGRVDTFRMHGAQQGTGAGHEPHWARGPSESAGEAVGRFPGPPIRPGLSADFLG